MTSSPSSTSDTAAASLRGGTGNEAVGRRAWFAWTLAIVALVVAVVSAWDSRETAEIAGQYEGETRQAMSRVDGLEEQLRVAQSQREAEGQRYASEGERYAAQVARLEVGLQQALAGNRQYASEGERYAAEVARLEVDLAQALTDNRRYQSEGGRYAAEVARLEVDLDQALTHNRFLGEALTAAAEDRERAAVRSASEESGRLLPLPFGVRRCIETMRRCFDAEGYDDLRILRASAIEDFTLRDVEFVRIERDVPVAELIVAARMAMTLDRTTGQLALQFSDGFRRTQGVRRQLPEAGFQFDLQVLDGQMWESTLPFLVKAVGDYPPADQEESPKPVLDSILRLQWIERIDLLLSRSGLEDHLRVKGFRHLEDAVFRDVRVAGYDSNKLLAMQADCEEMAIEVDARAGIVSLLFRQGSLRREGTESKIGAQGYRILLPDVTPEQAVALMLGMVIRK